MENEKNKPHLGDGVKNAAVKTTNENLVELVQLSINGIFKYLKEKGKDIPEIVSQLLSKPETAQEIAEIWSDQLAEKGLISKAYAGLPNEALIHNLRQEGYMDGLFAGYAIALMALADNDVQEDKIIAVRDTIRPNLYGHCYEDRKEFLDPFKSEKYNWIDKARAKNKEE